MTDLVPRPRPSGPPARQLRLLANLAPAATVVFGIATVWLAVTTLRNLAQPMSFAVIVPLVVGTFAVAVAGLVTYRLGVETPRTLRGWEAALVERAHIVRGK